MRALAERTRVADDDLLFRPALELARMVREREVSPVELAELCLERIDRLNGELNAVVTVDGDGALDAARAAASQAVGGGELPPFLGVPTAIKDVHATAGMRTTFGARAMADFVPSFDTDHVRRLRDAGFVLVGKTNTPEFGTVPYTESELLGPARNPWDTSRTAGGSSGGAGAALAAGLVPVADGSDGGGSIRVPASACGLFGLKPARGRVSNAPLFGDIYLGIVTPGPLSRTVADAAAMLDVESGYVPGDPHWAPPPERPFLEEARREPGRLRIALVTEPPLPDRQVDPQVRRETEAFARLLESLGHSVEPLELPVPPQLADAFHTLWTTGLAATPVPRDRLEPYNRELAERGARTGGPELLRAFSSMQLACRALVAAMLPFDAVVTPTLLHLPFKVGASESLSHEERYEAAAAFVGFCPLANMTGQPSVSLPVGWSDEGLPIGVMATGRPADEATLLRLSAQVEAATDWPSRRPPRSSVAATAVHRRD
jgi:amidase